MKKTKCLIIGSGPAGYTAAIYASRAEMKPILYRGNQPGGQLTITNDVENFPGYPNGVMGPEMMLDLEKQATRFGTEVKGGVISEVDFNSEKLIAISDENEKIEAETIIISTGASAKWLGLESEKRLNAKGVSACAVCDGYFFKGQDVMVVGAGDSACEEAHYLSKMCPKVYMLVRRDQMRASKTMQNRVKNTKNIEIIYNSETDEILGKEEVEAVRIYNNKTKEKKEINIKGFFVAIGHTPNTQIFKNYIKMDTTGYIITEPNSTKTNIKGVFACGDAQDKIYRQAITAAGTGCMAALDAERYLASLT